MEQLTAGLADPVPPPAARPPRERHRARGDLVARLERHLVLYGVGLVALQLAFRGWALAGSWFYFDDIAFMSRAMNQPLDASYLLESYGGHLMPAGFLVNWLLTDVAVYTWEPWAGVLLALQAVAGLGMLRLLVSLFGRKPFVLALLAGYLTLVFTLSVGIWWAAGINQLPMQVALVFGLHAHVQYLRTRRLRSLAAALAWTVFGLVFYEKTLLLLGIYAIFGFGWFTTGTTPDRLRQLWTRYRAGVLAYGVLGVAYVAFYIQYGLDFSPGTANAQPWSPIAYQLVGTTMLPGLVGGPLQWQPLSVGAFGDPSQLVVLVSWASFAGVVVHGYRSRTKSLRAWSLLAFTAVCNVLLLASARANVVGPDIAREFRYQTETSALFVLALGLAFLPLLGAPEQNEERESAEHESAERENPRLVAAISIAVVAAAMISSVRYVDLWQERNPSKQYFAHVAQSLSAAEHKPVPLADLGIPQTLLWSYRYPENAYSHVFRNHDADTSYPRASVDRLYVFDDQGQLSPATIPPTRQQLGGSGCGFPLTGDSTTVPLDGPVIGGGWWIRISYASPEDADVHVRAGEEEHDLSLPAGLHNVFLQAAGEFNEVQLTGYGEDTGLCVTALTLGLPVPTPTPS